MNFFFNSEDKALVDEVGGKGFFLQKLVAWSANVSPFFILSTLTHEEHEAGRLPESVKKKINSFLDIYPKIALRSSMIGEDNIDASFAGMFETKLNVTKENWEESLKAIYGSIHSGRVQAYVKQKKIITFFKMAVVVQAQVDVEKSGVLFTRAPIGMTSAIAIDAGLGMGEGVVSGHTEVDHYLLTRLGQIIDKKKAGNTSVLSEIEIKQLLTQCLSLEKKMGVPSDIEWGILNDELYIFQIRPITRSFTPLRLLVDTNLSESYPGNVSPFTASFVKKAYENVFIESAIIIGSSPERLKKLAPHFKLLIASVDNHLYYNLEHYYAALRFLPGGEKNIENWHRMIGGKIDNIEVPFHSTGLSRLENIYSIYRLIKIAFLREKVFKIFLKDLEDISQEILIKKESLRTSHDQIVYMSELIDRPLQFGLTLINDAFIFMGLGFLAKSQKKKGQTEDSIIDLLRTSKSLDSLKPLELLNELIAQLSEAFITDFIETPASIGFTPYGEVFKKLKEKGWDKEVGLLINFLSIYGDRSFEELKIESLPLKNNPILFKHLIRWSKASNNIQKEKKELEKKELEKKVALNFIEKRVLIFTRQCIEAREATRLWRGRFYHILRDQVLRMIKDLIQENPKWNEFELLDFFSLTHHEWLLVGEGQITFEEAKKIIVQRRNWQLKNKTYPEALVWAADEPLPFLKSEFQSHQELRGQGVSSGIVEGVALVLEKPEDAFQSSLKDFILVTKNTDPAWVYIMSKSKGLVSEKGSMLSHTAIIGRELGIPTVVGAKMVTKLIHSGDLISINGSTGEIKIL